MLVRCWAGAVAVTWATVRVRFAWWWLRFGGAVCVAFGLGLAADVAAVRADVGEISGTTVVVVRGVAVGDADAVVVTRTARCGATRKRSEVARTAVGFSGA